MSNTIQNTNAFDNSFTNPFDFDSDEEEMMSVAALEPMTLPTLKLTRQNAVMPQKVIHP